MGVVTITPELIQQIARDLIERYSLDAAGVREVGEKLAADPKSESETREFAERMLNEHAETFDRLSR
ncbi:MAG: hypothetical protein NTY57_04000 [Solirubrobacterales bacterium]|jgi:hypothetical protein|nr:hypothetical protein [Solirubrobacterales bacterium]